MNSVSLTNFWRSCIHTSVTDFMEYSLSKQRKASWKVCCQVHKWHNLDTPYTHTFIHTPRQCFNVLPLDMLLSFVPSHSSFRVSGIGCRFRLTGYYCRHRCRRWQTDDVLWNTKIRSTFPAHVQLLFKWPLLGDVRRTFVAEQPPLIILATINPRRPQVEPRWLEALLNYNLHVFGDAVGQLYSVSSVNNIALHHPCPT